jgi:hypothetical protein
MNQFKHKGVFMSEEFELMPYTGNNRNRHTFAPRYLRLYIEQSNGRPRFALSVSAYNYLGCPAAVRLCVNRQRQQIRLEVAQLEAADARLVRRTRGEAIIATSRSEIDEFRLHPGKYLLGHGDVWSQ